MRATPQAVSFDTTSHSPSLAKIRHSSSSVRSVIVTSGSDSDKEKIQCVHNTRYYHSLRPNAHLVVGGKRNSNAASAKNSSGIAAIRNDDLLRGYDRNNGGRSDGIASWGLKFASTV
ncbi:hypothetical protein G4B88_016210 [Cannabis sativa]|uniref:Uncharacterized protein n=1 Tax=Cannabis sativa TaxID=3483 RepID=A0A7J6EYV4_CANSA|nr:hypothetical protein G4B88_016210 [Cannabis sativa]